MGENFLLMDDNARPHRADVVDTFLQNHAIARMNWPARSPDLNLIDHPVKSRAKACKARLESTTMCRNICKTRSAEQKSNSFD
ncbi:MAP4K1 [Cordylochernes scorpioides]|uniref:MAP4K1 n=1 Tax=Cordylochernes scorpioides TaxID=51811 RepID=A0ABY6JYM2_9ARAC|nr:MAP4K1 [Cordylochernes scorpioides]